MLFGDVTRIDCQNTSQAQDLPLMLYGMACDHDDEGVTGNPEAALPLIELRTREAEILNSRLRSRSDGRRTSYDSRSIIILDCPSAFGGICVINHINSHYVRIDKFMHSTMASDILYQPEFFLEAQIPSPASLTSTSAREPLNEDVLAVAQEIRFQRFIFDNPQMRGEILDAFSFGARIFLNLMKYFLTGG